MQSVVIVLLGLCALACAVPPHKALNRDLDEHWGHFKRVHNKQYHLLGEEFNRRLTWEKNVKLINDHNLLADLGHVTYRLGLNQFADLTNKEFAQRFNGYRANGKSQADTIFKATGIQTDDTVDWRTKGYVTPVKDQAQCGSCWAFSSTGSIEGQHFKKTGKLVSLSEQNLVDCSTSEGNAGCGGGWMDQAFAYIVKQGGIDTEASYPYTAEDGQCTFKVNAIGARLTGHVDVDKTEDALKEATATIGPISVAIDAAHSSFQLYKSGVYVEQSCQLDAPDHAVLVVGYGTEDGKDYWLVKNSWADTWGDKGYIKMMRNFHNMCGIANYATYPTL